VKKQVHKLFSSPDPRSPSGFRTFSNKLSLFVHIFTSRNEKKYLAADYRGDPSLEYLKFSRLGVDRVFTDFTHPGVSAGTPICVKWAGEAGNPILSGQGEGRECCM
jgi:hypothetical protein